jgi:hypothetical protein
MKYPDDDVVVDVRLYLPSRYPATEARERETRTASLGGWP